MYYGHFYPPLNPLPRGDFSNSPLERGKGCVYSARFQTESGNKRLNHIWLLASSGRLVEEYYLRKRVSEMKVKIKKLKGQEKIQAGSGCMW
ncbi:MAG: hypothetical protein DWB56_14465 [Candidatus Jettenia sp.]|nr:MAG: hypothetical protein EDM77_11830 [Candidatus Jettenia sp. AMX1]MBC6930136.1 hypothetical protein [Candidatus Jettenia sp.]MCE7881543.1 hypothetical protein [Candidatus Jettenia sp. AMX1]MCQ3927742.1 hypothetical protein [Candidatus Jettenia sp.]